MPEGMKSPAAAEADTHDDSPAGGPAQDFSACRHRCSFAVAHEKGKETMKATAQMEDIIEALGPSHPTNSPTLMIALKILAQGIFDAELKDGMPVRDVTDFRLYLLECALAIREIEQRRSAGAKKETVRA
jgi:hypothetical protein